MRKIIRVLKHLLNRSEIAHLDLGLRPRAILSSLVAKQKNVPMLDIESVSRNLRRNNSCSVDELEELVPLRTERDGTYFYGEGARHLGSGRMGCAST